MQLSLFPSKQCQHCKKAIGPSPVNPVLLDGFFDNDEKAFIHNRCRSTWHQLRAKGRPEGITFSEVPVTLHQLQYMYRNHP